MNKINHLSILGLTFSRACSHSAKLKQVWLCSRLLAALAALYVVTVFATAFLGYLSPYAWVFFPAIAALLGVKPLRRNTRLATSIICSRV